MIEATQNPRITLASETPHWWQQLARVLLALRVRRAPRRLQLCESISLGEKRIVAVIQYDAQRFLIGGSGSSLSLLARLGEGPDFAAVLTEWCERQR